MAGFFGVLEVGLRFEAFFASRIKEFVFPKDEENET